MLVTASETKDFVQYSSNVTQGCSTGGWRGEGAIESGMAWWIGKQVEISVFLMLVFAAASAGALEELRSAAGPSPLMECGSPLSSCSRPSCDGSPFNNQTDG